MLKGVNSVIKFSASRRAYSSTTSQQWLPGIANAHSHAFQRLIRGRVQSCDPNRSDSFWTWREKMYAAVGGLDVAQLEDVARECYIECLEAGYTAVGEFHYVHHQPSGAPHDDPVATSRAMLRAARQAGLRMNLLYTVYARGGLRDEPLSERQQRFGASSLDDVERALDLLAADPLIDGEMGQLGIAIHSVRAVPPAWLGPLAEMARSRGLVLHAHASEQRIEVDECRAVTGLSPIALLNAEGVLSPSTTIVHATHLDDADVSIIARSGAGVCLCPTTEGDLGDGVPRTADLYRQGVPLSVGSDSHATIDPFAELRSTEYQARAATGERCIVRAADGSVAPTLLHDLGHANGYAALGLPTGDDAMLLDGSARALRTPNTSASEPTGPSELLAACLTAGHPGLVSRVRVAGEEVVVDGRHAGRRSSNVQFHIPAKRAPFTAKRAPFTAKRAPFTEEPAGSAPEDTAAAARPLRTLGDPVLRIRALPVAEADFGSPELDALCASMVATMRAANGAGIAAPQIGVSRRIFVVHGTGENPRYPYKPTIPLTVFVNPEIDILDDDEAPLELIEGCLSVPGWRGQVVRHAKVRVRARRPDGSRFEVLATGHAAGTMQHENDHLNSTLFPDIARPGPYGPEKLMSWAAYEEHYAAHFVPYALSVRDLYPEAFVMRDA